MVIAFGRWTKSPYDDSGFLVSRQQFLHERLLALNAVEGFVKSLLDEPLSTSFHGSCSTGVCLGDPLVRPTRPLGVRLQQNPSTSNLWTRPLEFLDDALKLHSF